MKRILVGILIGLGVICGAWMALTARTDAPRSQCALTHGMVSNIFRGGMKDVVFELEGKKNTFYIDGGIEHGFDVKALEKQLLAEDVVIYYADRWTPLSLFGAQCKRIREIRNGNWIVYSEF